MSQDVLIDSAEHARLAVDLASEKLASDVVLLDLRGVSDFADYFVILTTESSRQMNSLADDLEQALKGRGVGLHHREGTSHGGWRLLDFGDIIVHMFGPDERDFYRLEGAWPEAVEVVRIQ